MNNDPSKVFREKLSDHELFPRNEKPTQISWTFKYIDRIVILGIVSSLLSLLIHGIHIRMFYQGSSQYSESSPLEVATFCAHYNGKKIGDAVHFRGVPYAVAPQLPSPVIQRILRNAVITENLRWAAPVPLDRIETCYAAHRTLSCQFNMSRWRCNMSRFRDHCYRKTQRVKGGHLQGSSEDCLYLEVIVPSNAINEEKLPVVVIIGGSHFLTDASERLGRNFAFHPNSSLAREIGAVVVSVQYRLGLFGTFFSNSSATEAVNFGLLDQIAALKWVRRNIEEFGGDPKRVTLLGHGSGATSGLALLAWQESRRKTKQLLFHQTWLSSGSIHIPNDEGKFKDLWKDLASAGDSRCKIDKFFQQICQVPVEFSKLKAKPPSEIYASLKEKIDIKQITSTLVKVKSLVKKKRQFPFIIIDKITVFDSPIKQAAFNKLGNIPIVLSSVASEFDGYPDAKDWMQARDTNIESDIIKILSSVLLNSTQKTSKIIWNEFLNEASKRNSLQSKSYIALEVISLLRVTCGYFELRRLLKTFNRRTTPVYQILQREPSLASIKGLLFKETIKRSAFNGFDILVLLNKIGLYMPNFGEDTLKYRAHLIKAFKRFIETGVLDWSSDFVTLDHNGIKGIAVEDPVFRLCSIIDYNNTLDFLLKLN